MSVQTYFNELADHVTTLVGEGEVANLSFGAEDSDFVRFNQSKVRQAGSVQQRDLSLDLIKGNKHCKGALTLAGDPEQDRARIGKLVGDLRERRDLLPGDPFPGVSIDLIRMITHELLSLLEPLRCGKTQDFVQGRLLINHQQIHSHGAVLIHMAMGPNL